MNLDKVQFITCFIAARLGQQSKNLEATGAIDPTVIDKAVSEAKNSSEVFWAYVQGVSISSTPNKKQKSKTADITDEQWIFLTVAEFRDDKLTPKQFEFVTDRFKCGKNQKLTETQSNWIDSLIAKIGD